MKEQQQANRETKIGHFLGKGRSDKSEWDSAEEPDNLTAFGQFSKRVY